MASNKTIQYILDRFYPDYAKQHKQPLRVIKSIEAQIRCRTEEQGTSHYICHKEGEHKEIFHSCRNKGCSICGDKRKIKWLESQEQRLLNCEHFHLVFTLPHEYLTLWLYNRKWFINKQFEVTSNTLKNLIEGNTYKGVFYEGSLNAVPGFFSTLHTWGRSLNLHPHIHVLMTAGGLTNKGEWNPVKNNFLLPVKQVKKLYRGKFQAEIKDFIRSEALNLPPGQSRDSLLHLHKQLYNKEWSVRIQEKYEQGNGVLIYLSRYLGSNPVIPEQVSLINNKEVIFSYRSHLDKKLKKLRLSIDEFLKKYFIHQAEPYVHTIRYYGLYASQAMAKRKTSIRILGKTDFQQEGRFDLLVDYTHEVICRCCGAIMKLSYVSYYSWKLKNPLYSRDFCFKGTVEGILAPVPP